MSAQGGNASVPTMVAFLLPWCGFSMQVEPLIEELAVVALMADLPVNVMRYDVTATNPLPEDIASTILPYDLSHFSSAAVHHIM